MFIVQTIYKCSIYVCKHINNSLAQRSENHWKYFSPPGYNMVRELMSMTQIYYVRSTEYRVPENQDIQSCMIFLYTRTQITYILQNVQNIEQSKFSMKKWKSKI